MDRIEEIKHVSNAYEAKTNEVIRKLNWALGMIESQQMVINGIGVDLDSQMRLISECITRGAKDVYMSPTAKLIADEIAKVQDMATKEIPYEGVHRWTQDGEMAWLNGFDMEGDITKLEFKMSTEDARGKFTTGACYRLVLESK